MTRSDPSSRFWNRIAKRYARSPVSNEATYQDAGFQIERDWQPSTREALYVEAQKPVKG